MAPRGRIYDDISETAGGTPLVRPSRRAAAAGVGSVLRARLPEMRIVAIEPEDSPVLSGGDAGGVAQIQAIGACFAPAVLDTQDLGGGLRRSWMEKAL